MRWRGGASVKLSDLPPSVRARAIIQGCRPETALDNHKASSTKPPATARVSPVLDGVSICIDGLKLVSEANEHAHWRKRQKRAKAQGEIVALYLARVWFVPMTATPTKCRPIIFSGRLSKKRLKRL